MRSGSKIISLLVALALGLTTSYALAAGAPPASTKKTKTCEAGKVYSKKSKKCVKKESEVIPDKDLIEQGWALAFSGRYEQAIDTFQSVEVKEDNAEVFTGVGFSHRKLGNFRMGLRYYKAALKIDPDYVKARQYLGEGYVSKGKLKKAERQLEEIEARCGTGCETYQTLEDVIAAAKTANNPS